MAELQVTFLLAGLLGASVLAGASNIRLANGPDSCTGRLEILHDGQWGTVCDDDWDMIDAEVVCRQLRCGTAFRAPRNAYFGQGSGPVWLNHVNCSGNEGDITQCSYEGFGFISCQHKEDAGVVCIGGSNIQLVNGSDSCSGRVLIYHDGEWGTVCDRGWDLKDADVVCRQLGCGKAVSAPRGAHFGQGEGAVHLHDVQCSGDEVDIIECSRGAGSHECNHDADAGVVCLGRNEVRLVNGIYGCCGRVEIQHKGRWGTVCHNDWDLHDAEVVCRNLGCGRAFSAVHGARFGRGEGPTWLDEVRCSGNESYLNQCSHQGFGQVSCGHNEDAGVVCAEILQPPILTRISSDSVVAPDEIVKFRCTTQSTICISVDFRLYDSGRLVKTQMGDTTTLISLTVDSSHQGQFTCEYSYGESSFMTSARSTSINMTVVSLHKPKITLGTISPQEPDVKSIICSTTPQYPRGIFHLEQSGSNLSQTQLAVNHSAVFFLLEVPDGYYSCTYEVNVSSRTFNSTTTEWLGKASPIPAIVSGVAGGLLLILIIVIIVMRRNKCKRFTDDQNVSLTPQEECEMDDKHDYENTQTHFKQEQEPDESDNDYVNVEPNGGKAMTDNNCGREQIPKDLDESVEIYANYHPNETMNYEREQIHDNWALYHIQVRSRNLIG